ncbi:MAG: hypothetical protein COB15_12005 [Flavobacteriales bacterium]|nr:MAG: hypothetical protein COB15_12005 [Flavobacteriales bacterium]
MKLYIKILLVSILSNVNVNAQTLGTFNKVDDFSLGNDKNTEIIYTEEKGDSLLLIGSVNSSGTHVSTHYGGYDVFIAILDSSRNIVYSQTIGGGGNDILGSVVKDNSGGYHLLARSNSRISGNKSIESYPLSSFPNTLMDHEIWHIKLDVNLSITGQYVYHPMNSPLYVPSATVQGVTITDVKAILNHLTNDIIIACCWALNWQGQGDGYSNLLQVNYQGVTTLFSQPIFQVAKSSGCGNGINTRSTKLSIKQLTNGEIIVYGTYSMDNCDMTTGINNIAKLNSSSLLTINYRRLVTYYHKSYMIHSVEELPNGNILAISTSRAAISGDRNIPGRISPGSTENTDIWVCELDGNFSIINEWAYGTNKGINTNSVIKSQIINNSLLILSSAYGGGASGVGLDKTASTNGGSDYWLLDIDLTTMLVNNDKSYGANDEELVTNLYLSNDYLYFVGKSFSNISLPDKTIPQINLFNTSYDGWIVKTELCNINTPLLLGQQLNPFLNNYKVEACGTDDLQFTIDNPNPDYYYEWTDISGAVIDTGNTFLLNHPTSPYAGILQETVQVYAIDRLTLCKGGVRDIKIVYAKYLAAPNLFNAPLPLSCKNNTVQLVADVSFYNNNVFNWYQYDYNNPFSNANNTYSLPLYNDTNYIWLNTYDSTCILPGGMGSCFQKIYCETATNVIKVFTEMVNQPTINTPPPVNCVTDSFLFTTTFDANLLNYKWFDDINYIDSIYDGTSYSYNIIETDTIYAVGYNSNGCPSIPLAIIMNTNELYPSFTTTDTVIIEGSYQEFINTSSSKYGITSYQWDFEDGLVNHDSSTFHYFYQQGYNDVTLTLTDSVGCINKKVFDNYMKVTPCFCNKSNKISGANVYPTLFTDHLNIEFDLENEYRLILYSLTGQLIFDKYTTELSLRINNLNVPKGTYILKIIGNNGYLGTSKVIKL